VTDGSHIQLRPEHHRSYLRLIAQSLLRASGPVRNKIDASDVVQETLLEAHRAGEQFRGRSEAELLAWLRTILANKLADAARRFGRKKRDAALERQYLETLERSTIRLQQLAVVPKTSPSQLVARHEHLCRVAGAMATLPEDQRTAIELHHLAGHSVAECAARMGRTRAAVAGLLRRGLKQLRQALEEGGSGPVAVDA
jgi:RNA polymerase sigma-70 factor (ECF subfamily)